MTERTPEGRGFQILLVPEGTGATRSFRIGRTGLRVAVGAGAALALMVVVVLASWWSLAARAARADDLEARLAASESRIEQVEALLARVEEVERRYEGIRDLFGSGVAGESAGPLLPPLGPGPGTARAGYEDGSAPTVWPLTRPGFVTQAAAEATSGGHPGLDIAVPSHSYIRAAGDGEIVEVGEDAVYGRFVVIDHDEGYRSLYGHASATLVEEGRRVRRSEVIALSGSTGRSSAPHLHFEILRDGEPVDPLSLVGGR